MKKNKKHLDFYKQCMETGQMPHTGLCGCAENGLISLKLPKIFRPNIDEKLALERMRHSPIFWGCGKKTDSLNVKFFGFTPLRQTIVLLMAAINKEL